MSESFREDVGGEITIAERKGQFKDKLQQLQTENKSKRLFFSIADLENFFGYTMAEGLEFDLRKHYKFTLTSNRDQKVSLNQWGTGKKLRRNF